MAKISICNGLNGKKKECFYHRNGWCDYYVTNGLRKFLIEKEGTPVKCENYEAKEETE